MSTSNFQPLVETYPPAVESIARARRALARLAAARGAAVEQIDAIRLAVSEAMTKAVRADGDGRIQLRAAVVDDGLAVSIDADRFELASLTPETELGPGVGLALIADAADELAIAKRASGGTEVRMRFGLGRLSPQT